jgi:acetylornithine deacetylase/succinyl-diaminopimelate desuccinylase-like protein
MSSNNRMELLDKLLRIPSHAGNAEAKREAAFICVKMLTDVGFDSLMAGPHDSPTVIARLKTEGGKQLLFYNHYDVVDAGNIAQWQSDPFTPTLADGKLTARGSSDHKASFVARLAAVDRLKACGELQVGVTFLVDGEEEIGSPSLEAILISHREALGAAGGLYSGGARDDDGRMVIRAGCKGRCGIRLTVALGDRDNHSKWAAVLPSSAWRLVAALASLRDGTTDKVLVQGFLDGVLDPDPRDESALSLLHFDVKPMLEAVGYKALTPHAQSDPLRALMFDPTFNLAWIESGNGGGTVLPGAASAMLDIRLVPGQTQDNVADLVASHLKNKGFGDVKVSLEGGSNPDKCDLADPVVIALAEACMVSGERYCIHPMGAGSGPRHLFKHHLGYSLVQDPGCSWHGSNDHAANENIMVRHFDENSLLIERFLAFYAKAGPERTQ